ncbi:FGGY family carbohydrate kinase [Sphingomonas suaedae]|nr:FGGY family carbohydrate kinase [Sphingomonas suaedae]
MMSRPVILAIDQGTTNTKALLVAADGSVLQSRSRAMRVHYPQPGWAEQSASDIWEAVAALIAELVAAAPGIPIAGLAISNQRETIVLWDARTGRPLAPAAIWQCGRSASRCAALRTAGLEHEIVARSGLSIDPLFPAAKIALLLDAVPGARERAARGEIRCGTIDSWLLWNLTGGGVHATDHSNASRTQLFNLDTLDWDAELARIFDVPMAILPKIVPSDGTFGTIAPDVTALPGGVPVQALLGDSHAALYAHGISEPGRVKATIGTGSSLMAATPGRVRSSRGLSSTIAWSRRDGSVQHALEGNISVSGHAVAFATSLLGLADGAALTALAQQVPDSGGVTFIPALAGLGAPHWQAGARGTISGMTLATRPAHVARATIEAVALQIGDVLDAIAADLDHSIAALSIDGGAARNDLLAQMLADLTGRTILRPTIAEASAMGVAMLAAAASGIEMRAGDPVATRFDPAMPTHDRNRIKRNWRHAVAGAIAQATG